MAKKTIEELFADFCDEHNIYAVASFNKNLTLDNVCETRANHALAGNINNARLTILDALADGCEQQSLRLHEFEVDREAELNMHISERAWFSE